MDKKSIKVLMIGNSLSRDASTHLCEFLMEAGYEDAVVAHIAVGGCSISSHWKKTCAKDSDYGYTKNVKGEVEHMETTMDYALQDEEWDIVTFQQATIKAAFPETFEDFQPLTSYVRANIKNKDAKFLWYLTWPFGPKCERPKFVEVFEQDPRKMFAAIIDTLQTVVLKNPDIDGFVPAGTAFMNMSTSYMGDVHEDGVHASLFVGRYVAAMTFAAYITGLPVETFGVTYHPEFCMYRCLDAAREAVANAIANPLVETPSKLTQPKPLKVLAIGNSFSEDSMKYLWDILNGAGIDSTVGFLHIGSCSIDQHWELACSGEEKYEYHKKNSPEPWKVVKSSLINGVTDEDWDAIVFYQNAFNFGFADTYGNLENLLDFVEKNKTNKNAKFLWHLTWAYQGDFVDWRFEKYDNDQEKMYDSHIDICKDFILPNKRFNGIIPTGTVIQGMRTSYLGDTLTRDGYHLSYDIGRYAAALSWAVYLIGMPTRRFGWIPEEYMETIEPVMPIIIDAIYYAMRQPYSFRVSKYTASVEFGLDTDYTKNKE